MIRVVTSRQPEITDVEDWLNSLEGNVIHFQFLPVMLKSGKTVYDVIALVESENQGGAR